MGRGSSHLHITGQVGRARVFDSRLVWASHDGEEVIGEEPSLRLNLLSGPRHRNDLTAHLRDDANMELTGITAGVHRGRRA
jgi:hypothetical protein